MSQLRGLCGQPPRDRYGVTIPVGVEVEFKHIAPFIGDTYVRNYFVKSKKCKRRACFIPGDDGIYFTCLTLACEGCPKKYK